MARKRKKVNRRKKENVPQPSIVEYASSTANLIIQMVKMAGENDCVDAAFTAFRDQIGDVLDEYQRDLMESLFYECHNDLEALRGSEKSTSKGSIEINAVNRETPEPVPKETEEEVRTVEEYYGMENEGLYQSLFGYGVFGEEAPGRFLIDKMLEKGKYSRDDIIRNTGLNKDTVRKRITYIQKHIPEVNIIEIVNPDSNEKKPILKAQLTVN